MTANPPDADLIQKSYALERAGQVAAALQHAQAGLERARAAGDAQATAAALNAVAFVHFRMGHYDQARALVQEALAQSAMDTHAHVDALLMLGMCANETNDLTAGEDYFLRAIDLSRQLGYHRALFRALHNLSAGVYMPRGKFELGLAADEEAYRLAVEHNMPELAWAPLVTTTWIYLLTGRHEQTRSKLGALQQVAQPGSLAEGFWLFISGSLLLNEGACNQVAPMYAHARSIAESTGAPDLNVYVRLGLSRYHAAIGDASTGRAWAHDAWTIAYRVGYRHMLGLALVERGRTAWLLGDCVAAEADLCAAIEVLDELEAAFDAARARFLLAALLHAQKKAEQVTAWRQAARRILEGNYAFLLEQERSLAFPLIAAHLNHADPELASLSAALVARLERVPPPPLRIITLGAFEVWQGPHQVENHTLHRRRAGELLALLLLSPSHSLTFDQITDALWRDKDPAAAQALFHQATSALRRALEPELPDKFPSRYVTVQEGQATLHLPPGSSLDFQAFEADCRQGRRLEAIAAYRGDLLPAYLYADWAAAARERLRRSYLRALLETARQQKQAGQIRETTDTCHRILEIDPWQEDAVLLGMQAYLACNDRVGAVRLYRDLEQTLREELDTAPQAPLRALYESLL